VILLIFFTRDDSAGKGEPSMPQREASQDVGPCPSQMPRRAEAANPDAEAALTFVIPWQIFSARMASRLPNQADGIATRQSESGAVLQLVSV
jgi:hypothetical protein